MKTPYNSLTVCPRSCGDCAGFVDKLRELEQSLYLFVLGEETGERQQGMCCKETVGAGEGTGPSKTPLDSNCWEVQKGKAEGGWLPVIPVQCIPLCCA